MSTRALAFLFALFALLATLASAAPAIVNATAPRAAAESTPEQQGLTSTSEAIHRRLLQNMDPVAVGVGSGIVSGVGTAIATGSIVDGVTSGVSSGVGSGIYTAVTGYAPWQQDGRWMCGPNGGANCFWNIDQQRCYCTGAIQPVLG